MDFSTLSFYLIGSAVSLVLAAIFIIFARIRANTSAVRSIAAALCVLAAGLCLSGFGPVLPRWMTVMGTNMLMIASGAFTYSGFSAYCEQRAATVDRFGWSLVSMTAFPFWYWGLVEPNGHYRSAVFSIAVAVINGRTAWHLVRLAMKQVASMPVRALSVGFVALSTWMAIRGVYLVFSEPSSDALKGANPTTWVTVFWYMVLVSVITIGVIWMEVTPKPLGRPGDPNVGVTSFRFVDYFRNKLLLLWGAILILMLATAGELGIAYIQLLQKERARLTNSAEISNDAFVKHTSQVVNQVDSILRAVRGFYLSGRSLTETEAFIDSLGFDQSMIDNVYFISADGKIVISHDPSTKGRSASDREYYRFHSTIKNDQIFISPVEIGKISGKFHFRISRRVDSPDGTFDGIVIAAVAPESFAGYYRELSGDTGNLVSLLGISDRKMRARVPQPPIDRWSIAVDSPLWTMLAGKPNGRYENTSPVDGLHRVFTYKTVGDLPLVMLTAFADDDVVRGAVEQMRWLLVTVVTILLSAGILAVLLTKEVIRQEEQDRFLSMLSHELKTPLSTIAMTVGSGDVADSVRQPILRSVDAMNGIVERCLQADRLQHGRISASPTVFRIESVVDDVRTACTAPERLRIQAKPAPSIKSDRELVSVILGNLVDNALKYGDRGCDVEVTLEPKLRKRIPGVLIEVSNPSGTARMPDARQVFRKYYRDASAHGKIGSGLGLYISAGFARKLGADLRYQPSADRVMFALWIPA